MMVVVRIRGVCVCVLKIDRGRYGGQVCAMNVHIKVFFRSTYNLQVTYMVRICCRHLFGFYFDWDEIRDRMNVLTNAPLI